MGVKMANELRSANMMVDNLLKDPVKLQEVLKNPTVELPKVAQQAVKDADDERGVPDNTVYRMMVIGLVAVALITAIGAIVLVAVSKEIPQALISLGSVAIGALAGALIPQNTAGTQKTTN
jgi:uncharacterized membrane protein